MSSSTFSLGDLVWAKMKGYPPWPARITTPPKNLKSLARDKKGHKCCFFFGSENYSWIPDEHVYEHSESMISEYQKRQSAQFREAVSTIITLSMPCEKDQQSLTNEDEQSLASEYDEQSSASEDDNPSSGSENALESSGSENAQESSGSENAQESSGSENAQESSGRENAQESSARDDFQQSSASEDDEVLLINNIYKQMKPSTSGTASKFKTSKEKFQTSKKHSYVQERSRRFSTSSEISEANIANPKKRKRYRKCRSRRESSDENDDENIAELKKEKRIKKFKRIVRPMVIEDETSQSSSRSNEIMNPVSSDEESLDKNLSFVPGHVPDSVPEGTERPTYVARPPSPEFDINEEDEIGIARRILPNEKRFGFVGLAFMGSLIAKHILHAGHYLTVWNRSPEKCDEFIEAGAHRGQTPADVVAASDIIFCCFSDTDAVNTIVFDNCGVLDGMDGAEKDVIVLNVISPYASIEMGSAIASKGGRYLEVFIHGTRTMAENATLMLITGGCHNCFLQCSSFLHAIAKDVFFVNYGIGEEEVVNIFTDLCNAYIVTSLAGVMSFVNRNGRSSSLFTEFLSHTQLKSNALLRNANATVSKGFSTDYTVKYVLQCLNSALELSNAMHRPAHITNRVHEHYKSA